MLYPSTLLPKNLAGKTLPKHWSDSAFIDTTANSNRLCANYGNA